MNENKDWDSIVTFRFYVVAVSKYHQSRPTTAILVFTNKEKKSYWHYSNVIVNQPINLLVHNYHAYKYIKYISNKVTILNETPMVT